jgi:hypothetical protein
MESLPIHLGKHIKVCLKEIDKMGRVKFMIVMDTYSKKEYGQMVKRSIPEIIWY